MIDIRFGIQKIIICCDSLSTYYLDKSHYRHWLVWCFNQTWINNINCAMVLQWGCWGAWAWGRRPDLVYGSSSSSFYSLSSASSTSSMTSHPSATLSSFAAQTTLMLTSSTTTALPLVSEMFQALHTIFEGLWAWILMKSNPSTYLLPFDWFLVASFNTEINQSIKTLSIFWTLPIRGVVVSYIRTS